MARPLRQRRPAGGAQIVREVVGSFKHTGSPDEVRERLVLFEERQRAIDKERYDALEARYRH
jgi:hypothetical protein